MKKILKLFVVFIAGLALMVNVYASEYSDIFNEVVNDGNITLPAVYKDNETWQVNMMWLYLNRLPDLGENIDWNYDSSSKELQIVRYENGNIKEVLESQVVNVIYEENDANIEHELDIASKLLPEFTTDDQYPFIINDLTLINYLVHEQDNSDFNVAMKYNEIISYYLNLNSHFDVSLLMTGGDYFENVYNVAIGELYLLYDGVYYDYLSTGIAIENIIYIPDTTLDTQEAYIDAITNRLNSYMPGVDFKVSYGGRFTEEEAIYHNYFAGKDYYNIEINGVSYQFVAETKPANELIDPVYSGKDTNTGISIESPSSDIPLNSKVEINVIEENTEEHNNISNKLESSDFYAFDLTLNSNGNLINEISGVATITVPLTESDSKYFVYHINNDENLEVLESELDSNGSLSFKTNLFDTYIISTKNISTYEEETNQDGVFDSNNTYDEIENPQTSDNIMYYVTLGIISVIMIITSTFILKGKN